jgi:cytochrome P450
VSAIEHPYAAPQLPVLGNLLDLRRDSLGFFLGLSRRCGDVGYFHAGPRRVVFVNSPELINTVLVQHADNFEKTPNMRNYLGPVLGNGLLTSLNAFHKRQRKLIAPAFQHRHVAGYADIMAGYAERIQAGWSDGATIDIALEMMRLTLAIVSKTLFDTELGREADEIGEALTVAIRYTIDKFSALVQVPSTWPIPGNRSFRRARARLDATIYALIDERRRSGDDHGDLLSMLLSAQDEDDGSFMTDLQVRDEVMSLFLAGHETTANALAWTWYLLAQHPGVYARLREELQSVLAGRTPTAEDLRALPFTLQVLKESMRLYPPVWVLGRQAIRAMTLGSYELPAGMVVTISPYALHRRPDLFPLPGTFDPERFTPDREKLLPRNAYIPFADGPRVCLGNHFAQMEGQLILATLAQRVAFDPVPGRRVKPEPLITLRPKGGIEVLVRRLSQPTPESLSMQSASSPGGAIDTLDAPTYN